MNQSNSHNAPPVEPHNDLNLPLREYWGIVQKRIWFILTVFVICFSAGIIYLLNQIDIYRAVSTVEIRAEAAQVLGSQIEPLTDIGARGWTTDVYYETQYRIISSRSISSEVVTTLQLENNLSFYSINSFTSEAEREQLLRQDPVDLLLSLIKVTPYGDSHLVQIAVEHHDPDLATLLANTIAEVYVERNARNQLRGTDEAFQWLELERESLRDNVESSERALLEFRDQNNIVSASLLVRQEHLVARVYALSHMLDEVRNEIHGLRSDQNQIERARRRGTLDRVPIPAVLNNFLIQALKEQRSLLLRDESMNSNRYGDLHHTLRGIRESIEELNLAIEAEVDSILTSFNVELASSEALETELVNELQVIESELLTLTQSEPTYNQLQREIQNYADILAMIETRYKETDLYRRQQDVNNIEILDAAFVPEFPVRPNKANILLITIICALFFSVGLAFLQEGLDNRIYNQEDIEKVLGLIFLGVIPTIKLKRKTDKSKHSTEKDLYLHHNPKSWLAECCRSIRTRLLFISPGTELKRILVTSAAPEEGKTTTCINLCTVMAHANKKILLVDTDMRYPRLHRSFSLSNNLGLTDLMLGEATMEQAIKESEIPNLYLLPCGTVPPNPNELLHTDRFSQIMDSLSEKFDHIILDSPPTIAVSDAMILGKLVDGVILVVQGGLTTKELGKRAITLLKATNAPLLGAIINDLDLDLRAYRYSRHYAYYSKYGGPYLNKATSHQQNSTESPM